MGWQDAPVVETSGWQSAPLVDSPNEPSAQSRLMRQVGLTARAAGPIGAGAAAGAAMGSVIPGVGTAVGAAGGTAAMTILQLVDKLGGTNYIDKAMDMMGVPKPENATERVVGDVVGAMAGQAGTVKGGELLAKQAGPVARNIGQLLATRPGMQLIGAAGGSGAAGATREAGGGPVAQTVAGLAGGGVAPVAADLAMTGAKTVGKAIMAGAKPFSQTGREQVVGETLRRAATDPARTQENLGTVGELVQGSAPTTAQAASDPGLLTAERALRSGPTGGRFAERASQQNQARNILLADMAGDEAALAAAKGARAGKAGALYEAARREGIDEGMAEALRPQIDNLMQRMPKGVLEKAKELARLNGEKFDGKGSVNGLHWMKLAVDDAIEGAAQTGVGKQTKGSLVQFKDDLLSVIDEVSPKYGEARKTFAELSKPVNQMEALQDVKGRVLNAGTDALTGERIMSPSKFYQAVTRNEGELAKVLTKDQMANLKALGADLERGALSDTAGKAAGSNTFQNLSTAYILGQSLGGKTPDSPLMQNLMRPLAWLNKLNEPELQKILTDAMLDPALAKSLMGKTSPRAIESVALELQQRAIALGLGAGQGTAQTVGARRERPSATQDMQQGR